MAALFLRHLCLENRISIQLSVCTVALSETMSFPGFYYYLKKKMYNWMLSRILKKPDKDFLNLEFSGFYMLFSCLFLYYACFLSYSFNDNFPVMSKIFSCLVYTSPVRPSKDQKQLTAEHLWSESSHFGGNTDTGSCLLKYYYLAGKTEHLHLEDGAGEKAKSPEKLWWTSE